MSEAIKRYTVAVAEEVLDDLRQRLANTRYPDQIEGTAWDYGTELGYLEGLLEYWREGFDWRSYENRLNALDNFTTAIDGQDVHFIHARSKNADALPLILVHGWPGSVLEFLDVIGPLTDPESHGGNAADAFHVIVPSLPGYGFSAITRSRHWDVQRMADAFATLMQRLGYAAYGCQGGDWGAVITTEMAIRHAQDLCGLHINMPLALPSDDLSGLSEQEKLDVAALQAWDQNETGYQRIQGSKPQTLGFGLNDSPAGLAAWIVEKFHSWSDCDGCVDNAISKDTLLADITLYWVTQTITSSMRLYYEAFKGGRMSWLSNRVEIPTGVARFPREIMRFPRSWVENHYNLTQWTEMPRGGHFAAMEQPDLFVDDVRKFFSTLR